MCLCKCTSDRDGEEVSKGESVCLWVLERDEERACVFMYMGVFLYVYLCKMRERERERGGERVREREKATKNGNELVSCFN